MNNSNIIWYVGFWNVESKPQRECGINTLDYVVHIIPMLHIIILFVLVTWFVRIEVSWLQFHDSPAGLPKDDFNLRELMK